MATESGTTRTSATIAASVRDPKSGGSASASATAGQVCGSSGSKLTSEEEACAPRVQLVQLFFQLVGQLVGQFVEQLVRQLVLKLIIETRSAPLAPQAPSQREDKSGTQRAAARAPSPPLVPLSGSPLERQIQAAAKVHGFVLDSVPGDGDCALHSLKRLLPYVEDSVKVMRLKMVSRLLEDMHVSPCSPSR